MVFANETTGELRRKRGAFAAETRRTQRRRERARGTAALRIATGRTPESGYAMKTGRRKPCPYQQLSKGCPVRLGKTRDELAATRSKTTATAVTAPGLLGLRRPRIMLGRGRSRCAGLL